MGWSIFLVTVLVWAGFGLTWWLAPDRLAEIWRWVADLPFAGRIAIWVLGLPWMVALALWKSSLPDAIRILASIGLAWATIWSFFPGRSV